MEGYYKVSPRVDEFIESLEMWELVYLWEKLNSKEAIVMMSDEIKKQVDDEDYWNATVGDQIQEWVKFWLNNKQIATSK
ncbi:MAG: hypothetical protein DRI89_11950 [Bacteroidetes bacterium]|nr:MAG: hypothetical protein DRI89_11950 [Bacteroidota bacterium]